MRPCVSLGLLEILSSYWVALSSLNEGFCFVLLNLAFIHVCCLLEACSLLKGNRGRIDLREREGGGLGGMERGKAMVWMYCLREKIYFQLKEEKV